MLVPGATVRPRPMAQAWEQLLAHTAHTAASPALKPIVAQQLSDRDFEALLVNAYNSWMKPWALRQLLVMPGEDVEDVVQEVVTRAWAKRHTYYPSNFLAWLSRIMTHRYIDERRRGKVWQMVPTGDAQDMELTATSLGIWHDASTEDQAMAHVELEAAVTSFLQRHHRGGEERAKLKLTVIALYAEGYTSAEIAALVGKTRSATASIVFRTHDHMRAWRKRTGWNEAELRNSQTSLVSP